MNLKLVVASMSVLGLVSCPVFAATSAKHKHHQMESTQYKDYKDTLPEPVCTISQNALILEDMNQNTGRALPNPCNPGWFNRIAFSGGINVDFLKAGNRDLNYMGVNYQRISLNDAYLNLAATVNDWTKVFASLSYSTATINAPQTLALAGSFAEYSAAYSNNVTSGGSSTVQLEQGYATIGNFDVTPFFLEIGKNFQDYGRYPIHPITRSMTQVLTETLATALRVGFIANGFNGSLFVFDDPLAKVTHSANTTNGGIGVGYDAPSDQLGWDIGAGYLYNMIGVNDVAYVVNQNNLTGNQNGLISGQGYHSRVSATALYADVNSGPFMIGARYTTALQRFNINDVAKNGTAPSTSGAKPWAASIQAGYGWEYWCKAQNIYVGYQTSREAAGLLLPKHRWLVGYGIDLFGKNTLVAIEYDRDTAYSSSHGGEDRHRGNLVTIRTAFKFA